MYEFGVLTVMPGAHGGPARGGFRESRRGWQAAEREEAMDNRLYGERYAPGILLGVVVVLGFLACAALADNPLTALTFSADGGYVGSSAGCLDVGRPIPPQDTRAIAVGLWDCSAAGSWDEYWRTPNADLPVQAVVMDQQPDGAAFRYSAAILAVLDLGGGGFRGAPLSIPTYLR